MLDRYMKIDEIQIQKKNIQRRTDGLSIPNNEFNE